MEGPTTVLHIAARRQWAYARIRAGYRLFYRDDAGERWVNAGLFGSVEVMREVVECGV